MKICGGRFRGRPLSAVSGSGAVRPTSSRTRGAIFNVLLHRDGGANEAWLGGHVLDVFAGTGALGLESLSRGAAHVTFIDSGRAALAALRHNIRALGVEAETTVTATNAFNPPHAPRPCALVFLDPPYAMKNAVPRAITALAACGWLAPGALIAIETAASAPDVATDAIALEDQRTHGTTRVMFCRYLRAYAPVGI